MKFKVGDKIKLTNEMAAEFKDGKITSINTGNNTYTVQFRGLKPYAGYTEEELKIDDLYKETASQET